ncbi:MAG: zinc ribbon domain-containing protein [Oscillospiraceae bacterium]|nr:zinc ribbon domain-containing protein [Oscillospiraceae bacterium]
MAYCSKCGAQNPDTLNYCGNCGVSLRRRRSSAPFYAAASRKKKRKWPFILAGIFVIPFVILFFIGLFSDGGYDVPDYGDAFAPSNTQGNTAQTPAAEGSSRFSDAVNALLEGGGFGVYTGSDGGETGPRGGGSVSYDEAYAEIENWTEDEWADFWLVMYECLDEEDVLYLESLSEKELIGIIVEIISEE